MEQNLNDKTACLVTAFQSGDVSAFSTLYDMHINLLFNYGCKLTTDKELLKDCIHDVFVKLYTKKAELGIIDNFKSYLLISLKNKLCDELRRRMFMSETAVEELNPVAAGDDVEHQYLYNPQIQISAESETKRSIFREKDKTKRSKKESAQHSKSRNKSFVMTSVSAL